jgi:hypothetical protein
MFLVQKCASSGHIKTSTQLFTVLKEGFDCFKIILVTHIHYEDFASGLRWFRVHVPSIFQEIGSWLLQ